MSTSSAEGSGSLSPSPVAPNAPKFGTLIPNRIFVGGIAANTTESELHSLFAAYGNVKATKIILDRAGVSKGIEYGFVTFETEEEAKRIQKEADVILKDKKLNIAPAIKKQPFARVFEPAPVVPNGTIMYPGGIPLTYPNGVTFYSTPDSVCPYSTPQTNFNVIYPSSVYLPQQSFQCHTAGAPYPPGPAVTEMAQFIPAPAPPHYFIPEHNF